MNSRKTHASYCNAGAERRANRPTGFSMHRWPRPATAMILLTLISLLFATPAFANDGELDLGFGVSGGVTTNVGTSFDTVLAVRIQTDGRIVAVGAASTTSVGGGALALARYNPDGSLDPSFGGGGVVVSSFGGTSGRPTTAVVQSDGKIVAAGASDYASGEEDFVLARYNADGSIDTSFGIGGLVVTDVAGVRDFPRAVVVQSDGKIIVAGDTQTSPGVDPAEFHFALVRYNPDGSLDPTFGFGGIVTEDFRESSAANALALQSDGKIVVGGRARECSPDPFIGCGSTDFALTRYNTDGSRDSLFGVGGTVTTDFGGEFDAVNALAIQSDGRIVAVGEAGDVRDFALARYNPDGSRDQSFGINGLVTTDFVGETEVARAVAIQADGKIIAAGYERDTAGPDSLDSVFALARYDVFGALDASFGSAGNLLLDFAGSRERVNTLAIQRDGKIVAAGYASISGTGRDFALARFLNESGAAATTDLAIVMDADTETVAAGSELTYTLAVTNLGPADATDVIVSDALPSLLSLTSCSATGDGVCDTADNDIFVTFPALTAGQTETITVGTMVNADAANGSSISNTAETTAATDDPDVANNTATVTTTVANPHTLRFYLYGNDVPGTAGGLTMNQTPGPGQPLMLNLAQAPTWFSEPALTGTFQPGAAFRVTIPRGVGLSLGLTFTLAATSLDGSGEQLLGVATVTPGLGLGPLTVTIPVTTPVTLTNQRLRLTISSDASLIVNLQSGSNAFLEATSFAGTP